ncbi:MAG: primase-helicase family protein, partial [Flavobacteriales bacterium]
TVALDYLTILLKHPKQMLPVPILVSPEQNTGKSTFLKWLQTIWGNNMAILGNAQFQMKFNGHYVSKFIISIDEGFLDVDKKAEKERLKQLVTADSVYLENKGMNVKKILYYGKVIICSNDADRVMKIENGESRWFVVRVPVIAKEDRDPDLELKLKTEIDAFLYFLSNRSVFHPRTDRLWFSADHFITDQYKVIVEATKNRLDRVFESWLKEQFLSFKLPVLRYTTGFLISVFNDPKNSKYKIDELELKTYLTAKGLKPETQSIYHKSPKGFRETVFMDGNEPQDQNPVIMWWSGTGRPYTFRAEDWLAEEELKTILVRETATQGDELPF